MTNGLSLSTVTPYKEADFNVLNNMLNKLNGGLPTVK